MKKADVQIGCTYLAKVSGTVVPVRIDQVAPDKGWAATNLQTGRRIHVKSAGRLRGQVGKQS